MLIYIFDIVIVHDVSSQWGLFFKIPSSSAKHPDIVDKDQRGSQTDGIYQLHTWYIRPKPMKHDAYHRFQGTKKKSRIQQLQLYGCFLKWRYPQNTPKWSFLVGKPMVIGYQHFRKPPYANSSDFEPMGYNSGYGNHFLHLDLMTNPPESLHQDRLILFHFQTSVGQLFWGWCWKYIYTSQKSFK